MEKKENWPEAEDLGPEEQDKESPQQEKELQKPADVTLKSELYFILKHLFYNY